MKPQKALKGQNQNAVKDAAGMPPFAGEDTRLSPAFPPPCLVLFFGGEGSRVVSQRCSGGSDRGREWGQKFGGGIREPFPSVRDHRSPPAILEQAAVLPGGEGRAQPRQGAVLRGRLELKVQAKPLPLVLAHSPADSDVPMVCAILFSVCCTTRKKK